MKTVSCENVKRIDHTWIELSDGIRLAARIWMPKNAEQKPAPAILEYIPYRLSDGTVKRDALTHPYFAENGFAAVRVDLRGSGNSEGVLEDEYLQQELDDGVEVIEWIAEQSWCNGDVGMIGISWGGFNGLQIAALQPEPLKGVVSVCSTDDRYTDDVHYMGGCLLGDNLSWASVMFSFNSAPPDPRIVGDSWREMWFDRLENSGLWIKKWLEHPHRDEYWKHGSICEDWSAIRIPVLAASGWADGYTNSVFRLVEKLQAPVRGLVGPWSHRYPHLGVPGPAIGFLRECIDWFNRCMNGEDESEESRPTLEAYMQDAVEPYTSYHNREGRWVGEAAWPSDNIECREFALAPGYALIPTCESSEEGRVQEISLPDQSPLSVGMFAGKWCSYAYAPDLPGDQREEDGGALIFESSELEEDVDILGAPFVDLELSSTEPVAMICVRLSDIAPNRQATRITYGLLNLTHRDSHEEPSKLDTENRSRARLYMNHIAQTFRKGHRIRISISTSYWPLAWAAPKPVRLTFYTGKSTFCLPVRKDGAEDDQAGRFGPAESAPPADLEVLEPDNHSWKVYRDLEKNQSTLEVVNDAGTVRIEELDLNVTRNSTETCTFTGNDFTSLEGRVESMRRYQREDWDVATKTRTRLTCDEDCFYIAAELDGFENGDRVFCKTWNEKIKRKLV